MRWSDHLSWLALAVAAAAPGCTGAAGDDTGGPITLEIASPTPTAAFTRDHVGALGALTVDVPVDLVIGGAPARVAIAIGGVDMADADPTGHAVVPIGIAGVVTLVATAYDAAGAAAATDEVEITVDDPELADCHAWLDLYQIEYTLGPSNEGVSDPVTATVPINGVPFRYVDNADPRERMFADCELILSLAKAASILRAHDLVEVADIGIYNYRCIGNVGTPPNCPNGMSQHAYAKAIDLAEFTDSTGTVYSVNDDWVIDPDEEATCAAATEPGKDAFLHQLICELKDAGTWNIVLTPNYNSDHRNHFHVDLTPDDDFIRERGRVDVGDDHH